MSKHTPGPWTIERCRCGHPSCRTYAIKGAGTFCNGCGFELADALLVSAAPDLLEALECIAGAMAAGATLDNTFDQIWIKKVIAKAKGE